MERAEKYKNFALINLQNKVIKWKFPFNFIKIQLASKNDGMAVGMQEFDLNGRDNAN